MASSSETHPVDHGEGPERFFLHHPGIVGNVCEHGGLEEVARRSDPVAARRDHSSLIACVRHEPGQRREPTGVGERTHLDAGIHAVADGHRSRRVR